MEKEYYKKKNNIEDISQVPKYVALVIALITLAIFLTGCVSNAKYLSAQNDLAAAEKAYEQEKEQRKALEKDKKLLTSMQEFVINSQDEMLMQKAMQVDSLQKVATTRNKRLSEVKNILENLKKEDYKVIQMDDRLMIELKNEILFSTGSTEISDRGEAVIENISNLVTDQLNNDVNLWIIGHTDDQPFASNETDNWELSSERALAVLRMMEQNGVKPWKLTAVAKGMYQPDAPNRNEQLRAENRRTEIALFLDDVYAQEILNE